MSASILIYGNGAMARVVYSYLRDSFTILGFTVEDAFIADDTAQFCGLPLYPFSRIEDCVSPSECEVIMTAGYVQMNEVKLRLVCDLESRGYKLRGYQSPHFTLHDDVEIDETAIILDNVTIHPGSRIGPHVFVSSHVDIGHDCTLERAVWVNGGVSLAGGVTIGAGSVLSIGCVVSHGVSLGKQVFIGANTLVAQSIADERVLLSAAGQEHRLSSKSFLKFANV